MIADIFVQEVVADQTDNHFPRTEPGRIELRPVADLRLQQVVARGRRFADRRDIVLREGVQQVDSRQPVGIAPEQAAADAHRRNPRNIGAVAEGRTHDVELVFDTPDTAMERPDIQLALELAAAEGGVALRIDRLVELEWKSRIGRADAGDILAGVARETTVNEPIELGVIGRRFEPERPGRPPQSDLDRLGSFQTKIGIADVEGGGRVMRAARK